MNKLNFSIDQLKELSTLEIKGGQNGGGIEPMSQIRCPNTEAGCGATADQYDASYKSHDNECQDNDKDNNSDTGQDKSDNNSEKGSVEESDKL